VTGPVSIAVGTTEVVARLEAGVVRVPKTGGIATPLFAPAGWTFAPGSGGLAVVQDIVYFTAANPSAIQAVFTKPVAGVSDPTQKFPVPATFDEGAGLATDGASFFWFDQYAVGGCAGVNCSTDFDKPSGGVLMGGALDADYYLWTNNAGAKEVRRCARPGCPTIDALYTTTAESQPALITTHKGIAYWLDNDTQTAKKARVLACSAKGCANNPKTLVEGEFQMTGLAVDDGGVYFSVEGNTVTPDGVVKVCRDLVNGCGVASEILADKQPQPQGIALDGQFAYWINKGVNGGTGSIVRIGK
jgi:hypothetical protein